jgi:hypothetical protein
MYQTEYFLFALGKFAKDSKVRAKSSYMPLFFPTLLFLICFLAVTLSPSTNWADPAVTSLGAAPAVNPVDSDSGSLCRSAKKVNKGRQGMVYAKTLADGFLAVGLFNTSPQRQAVDISWAELGISGKQTL